MPQLIKQFTTKELWTHNDSVCNPSILIEDGLMSYRDGRGENKDDNSKLLKIAIIDKQLNVKNCYTISISNKDLSDPRLIKWNNKIYVVITQIILRQDQEYLARMDLLDMRTNALLGLTYDKAGEREKNWIFFEHEKQLLCSRSLWNGEHQVLKLNGSRMEDYSTSSYKTNWQAAWGDIRNTSNFTFHNGLIWGCFHSHDGNFSMPATYRCGLFAFEPRSPFQIVKMSNVPLFHPRYKADILYPNHLDILPDGSFRIGMGVVELDHFDILTLSAEEVSNHLNNNTTYDYIS